jgi:hypothetical protein
MMEDGAAGLQVLIGSVKEEGGQVLMKQQWSRQVDRFIVLHAVLCSKARKIRKLM